MNKTKTIFKSDQMIEVEHDQIVLSTFSCSRLIFFSSDIKQIKRSSVLFMVFNLLSSINFYSFFFFSSLVLCTTSVNSTFSIFQIFIFKRKILAFSCLPSLVVEINVDSLFIIVSNCLRLFVSLKPHHMLSMETP